MDYFNQFPLVSYGGEYQVDITKRAGIPDSFKNDSRYYIDYFVAEGDTPEIIADKIYDDARYAWVILEMNSIVNFFESWPMEQYALDEYVKATYSNPYGIHHYVSGATGAVIDPTVNPSWDNIPVTNYEHETKVNEAKRSIKLLMPDYVATVAYRHKELMQDV
jgi:hypothetical protein